MTEDRAIVLIAEDNPVNQLLAGEILSKHGFAFEIASDGAKALTAATSRKWDLILMDCSMPEISGPDVTRAIRRREANDPTHPHVPIVALTANAIKGDREHCLDAGMDDYVTKPVDATALVKVIQSYINNARRAVVATQRTAPVRPAVEPAAPFALSDLIDRCMSNAGVVTMILDEFNTQALHDLAALQQHLTAGEVESAQKVAHALKGASSVLSAESIRSIAAEIEAACRRNEAAAANELIVGLKEQIDRCLAYLPAAKLEVSKLSPQEIA